jgi:hypothetical protein
MKYFKTNGSQAVDIDKIAGEAINIAYGKNYYVDGKENPYVDLKKPYTVYTIDSVEYEIHPNVGIIFILAPISSTPGIKDRIRQKIEQFERDLITKYGMVKPPVGIPGTTQYLAIEDVGNTGNTGIPNIVFAPNVRGISHVSQGARFSWNIVGDVSDLSLKDLPVRSAERDTLILSLSSIIYDTMDTFTLPDGYLSPDYPSSLETTAYKKDLFISEPIIMTPVHGLVYEIARAFNLEHWKNRKEKKIYGHVSFPKSHPLNWIKWDDVKPIVRNDNVLDFVEQIKDALDYDSNLADESDVQDKNADHTCFVTGIPLYDDIYVFDVYQQIIETFVDTNDLANFPGAEIIPTGNTADNMANSNSTTQTDGKTANAGNNNVDNNGDSSNDDEESDEERIVLGDDEPWADYMARKKAARKKAAEKRKKKAAAVRAAARAAKKATETASKNISKGKVKAKKTAVDVDRKKNKADEADSADSKNDVNSANNKSLAVKMPIKRGQSQPVELVKIRRVLQFDTPKHLLISPYFIHCMNLKNPIELFERMTKTKVLVFRTKVPRDIHNVIDLMNTTTLRKKVLHNLADCANIKNATDVIVTKDSTLYKGIYIGDLMGLSENGSPNKEIKALSSEECSVYNAYMPYSTTLV